MKNRGVKTLLIPFLLLTKLVIGQHCDTLFSNEDYIHRYVKISYRNCTYIDVDTVYEIHGYSAVDSANKKQYLPNLNCYTLFNSNTGKLIQERWEDADTAIYKEYYSSGGLKGICKSTGSIEPYYFWSEYQNYFGNGQVKSVYIFKIGAFSTVKSHYPNGTVFSKATFYDSSPSLWGDYIEYFPNGQASSIRTYSQPNTHDSLFGIYQESELLKEVFYDQAGNEIDHDLNEWNEGLTVSIYPPEKTDDALMINDTLYTSSQFRDQVAYSNNLSSLKSEINKHLKLSKKCDCPKGIAWVTLIVTKSGELLLQEIEFPDEEVNAQLAKAIQRVKKWPPALIENNPVDTYIHTFLIINR